MTRTVAPWKARAEEAEAAVVRLRREMGALRLLARRATEFIGGGGDEDVFDAFKEALEAWWEVS